MAEKPFCIRINNTHKKDARRCDWDFDGPLSSPSSIWSPYVNKRVLSKMLILRVVIWNAHFTGSYQNQNKHALRERRPPAGFWFWSKFDHNVYNFWHIFDKFLSFSTNFYDSQPIMPRWRKGGGLVHWRTELTGLTNSLFTTGRRLFVFGCNPTQFRAIYIGSVFIATRQLKTVSWTIRSDAFTCKSSVPSRAQWCC